MEYKEFLEQFYSKDFVEDLIEAQKLKPISGLRLNPLKLTQIPFINNLEKHPIIDQNCYLFDKEINQLGKTIYHEAGCYYIQEPAAMLVGHFLNVKPTDKIIDLCAAPGGKSTFVAPLLTDGFLVSNDVNFSRSLDLLENIERLGIKNCFVTNEKINVLEKHFFGYFDKVILDAPCSGEGMFRKNKNVNDDWSIKKVNDLSNIQKELILQAYNMLKYKGIMVYSTCTFNPLENEEVIKFLLEKTNAKLIKIDEFNGIDRAINMPEAIHIFPNHFQGEGHFICLIECNDDHQSNLKISKTNLTNIHFKLFHDFVSSNLNIQFNKERLFVDKENIYYLVENAPNMININTLKYCLHLGTFEGKIFIPSHHFATTLNYQDWKFTLNYEDKDDRLFKYLDGQANFDFISDKIKLYCPVCINKIPIGLVKIVNGQIKNYYPKKLRGKIKK